MSNRKKAHGSKSKSGEHLWLVYPVLFVSVMLVSYFIFSRYSLFHTDTNSTRYMLSALIQSEAAIIAIVVTLTLVAVQLTASSYSLRTLEILTGNRDLWVLMALYIGSIIYGLIVLKTVEEVNFESAAKVHIYFSCSLGFFCFAALLPYTYKMLYMLQPSIIIGKLSGKINRNNLLEENPISPIVEIMLSSIKKYDSMTAEDGIRTLVDKISQIFETGKFTTKEDNRISQKVFNQIQRVGQEAVNMGDDDSTKAIIEEIAELSRTARDKGKIIVIPDELMLVGLRATVREGTSLVGHIGMLAARGNQKRATGAAITQLYSLGLAAIMKELHRTAKMTTKNLEKIAEILLDHYKASKQEDEESLKMVKDIIRFLDIFERTARGERIPEIASFAYQSSENVKIAVKEFE